LRVLQIEIGVEVFCEFDGELCDMETAEKAGRIDGDPRSHTEPCVSVFAVDLQIDCGRVKTMNEIEVGVSWSFNELTRSLQVNL
jgi:hypothetical protein